MTYNYIFGKTFERKEASWLAHSNSRYLTTRHVYDDSGSTIVWCSFAGPFVRHCHDRRRRNVDHEKLWQYSLYVTNLQPVFVSFLFPSPPFCCSCVLCGTVQWPNFTRIMKNVADVCCFSTILLSYYIPNYAITSFFLLLIYYNELHTL